MRGSVTVERSTRSGAGEAGAGDAGAGETGAGDAGAGTLRWVLVQVRVC